MRFLVCNEIVLFHYLKLSETRGRLKSVLLCVYINGLLRRLRNAGVGCYIGDQFVGGALAYVDDLALIAPTATAMRSLLAICDNYALQHKISFNASKSKWLAFIINARHALHGHIDRCSFYIKQSYRTSRLLFTPWSHYNVSAY